MILSKFTKTVFYFLKKPLAFYFLLSKESFLACQATDDRVVGSLATHCHSEEWVPLVQTSTSEMADEKPHCSEIPSAFF